MRIQSAGRLVGHDDGRTRGDCPGDGHALLLTAGHLRRVMFDAFRQSDAFEGVKGHIAAVDGVDALINQGQLHVFQYGQRLNEVVLLEDKANLFVADTAKLLVGKFAHVGAVQTVLAACGDVQTAQHVHHRGLAGAGLPHNGDKLPAVNVERHAVKGADFAFQSLAVNFVYVNQFNQMRHSFTTVFPVGADGD